MTKNIFKSVVAVLLVAATFVAAAAEYKFRLTQKEGTYTVPDFGINSAIIELYATFGADVQTFKITLDYSAATGFTFNKAASSFSDKVIGGSQTINSTGTKAVFSITGQQGVASIKATETEVLLATIVFDVTDDALEAGRQVVSMAVNSVKETAGPNSSAAAGSDTGITIPIYSGFNFKVLEGATFEIDEDVALTIDAADPEKFEASAWDTATSSLQPTTDVEFTGTATIKPTDAGSIAIKNGKLVFTPAANWNGEVNVSATAKSKTIADTDTNVNFTVTVNAVSDPLDVELTANNLVAVEGEAVSGTLTLTATDVDGGKSLTGATVTLGDEFLTVEGSLEQQGSQDGVTTYLFTATGPVVPYTAVVHPASSADYDLTVVAFDETDEYELEDTVTVGDTDQLIESADFAVNGESQALEVKADATLTAEGSAEDPDEEDDATVAVQWSEDGQGWGTTQPTLAKGMTIYAKGVATSSYALKAYSVDSATVTITVTNSAPVVPTTWGSIFVLRNEDAATPKPESTTFTATDADGAGDLRVCAERTRSAEPSADTSCTVEGQYGVAEVALEGETIIVTYTVNTDTVSDNKDVGEDIKFYVTDADEKDFIEVTVNCTFQANPPPVLALAEGLETEIPEVDDAEAPRAFILTVHGEDEAKGGIQAGVSKWELIDLPEGWQATADPAPAAPVTTGVWSDDATWTITTAGFGTLDGANRPAAQEFTVKVRATDVKSGAEVEIPFTVKVSDTDRAPEAPQSLGFDPAEVKHGDTLAATATGAETDADGDAVTFTYAWSYSVDGGATFTSIGDDGNTLADAAAFKRGYVIRCEAVASATPAYEGGEAKLSEGISKETTVGNTAPAAEEATIWTLAEGNPETEWVTEFTDVDVDDGVDELTYALGELSNPDAGELALSEDGMTIAFTPAADYNTVETGDEVTFTVTATDLGGATATTTVTLVIIEKNTAPSFSIADQYVLPSQLGEPVTVAAIEVTMGENEGSQGLSLVEFEVLEGADLFDAEPTAVDGYEGASEFSYTFTIKADAALGSSAKVKVTVTDNGTTAGEPDPMEAEAEFTIFLGASPWYPILSFECADPENHTEGHTVVIDGSDNSTYSITLKGATYEVLPADYVAIGHPGYEPGTELTITVYPWTLKEGTATEECAATTAAVADYVAPSEATTDGETELTTDENGFVELPKFSVPMAKSYTVVVKKDGVEVQTIEDDFAPNDEGMVLPDVEGMTLQLTEAGEYTIEVSGASPAGESEAVVLFTVTSEGGEAIDLADEEWAGEFLPEDGAVLGNASVRFSWPALLGATSYELTVINGDGKEETFEVSGTSKVVELAMDADVVPYTWFVTATNSKGSKESGVFALVLSEALGDAFVITKVVADDNGLKIIYVGTLPEDDLFFSYQYFDVDFTDPSLAWTNGSGQATETAVEGLILPMVATSAGDFVVLKQGNGDWKIYEVQEP